MASQIVVTATLTDPSGTPLTPTNSNAFVRFRLRNFTGFIPQVQLNAVLAETKIDAFPNGSGQISQTLWPNSVMVPANTFYTVEYFNFNRITSSGNYIFNSNTDLDTAAQINAPPAPPRFALVLQNNGADNSSQDFLNLESSDGSVLITDEGAGTLDLQVQNGDFLAAPSIIGNWEGSDYTLNNSGSGVLNPGIANQVEVFMFRLPFTFSFHTLRFYPVSSTTSTLGFGIYSTSGTRLQHWDSVSGAGGYYSGLNNATVATAASAVQLSPGTYYWAWSSSLQGIGAPLTLGSLANANSNENSAPWNNLVVRGGTAANAMVAGVLPATLGTLTAGFFNGNTQLPCWTVEP